jgi:hypothetical protein
MGSSRTADPVAGGHSVAESDPENQVVADPVADSQVAVEFDPDNQVVADPVADSQVAVEFDFDNQVVADPAAESQVAADSRLGSCGATVDPYREKFPFDLGRSLAGVAMGSPVLSHLLP